jgi:hypothetical protein
MAAFKPISPASPASADTDVDVYLSDDNYIIDLPPDLDVVPPVSPENDWDDDSTPDEPCHARSTALEPAPPHNSREEQLQRLQALNARIDAELHPRQLLRAPVEGDGNCLFRSIALQVYGSEHQHPRTRSEIMDHLERYADSFEPAFRDMGTTAAEYIARSRGDAQWGGFLEMVAAEEVYNHPVFYLEADKFERGIPPFLAEQPVSLDYPDVMANPRGPVQRIRLLYSQSRGHHDAIIPIGASTPFGIGRCHDPASGQQVRLGTLRDRPTCDLPRTQAQTLHFNRPTPANNPRNRGTKRQRSPAQQQHPTENPKLARACIAIHPNSLLTLTTARSALYQILDSPVIADLPALADAIRSCIDNAKQAINRDGVRCFQISSTVGELEFIQKAMVQCATTTKWHTTLDMPLPQPIPLHPINRSSLGKFLTLNLHGMAGKRQELMLLLESNHVIAAALQETRRTADKLVSVWPGYLHESLAGSNRGEVGVGVMVCKQFASRVVGKTSRFHIAVHVTGARLPQPCVILSVYIPCAGPGSLRNLAIATVSAELRDLQNSFPGTAIVAMGDYNSTTTETAAMFEEVGASIVRVIGDNRTRHTINSIHRDIDHIVSINAGWLPFAKVDRTWPNGDHWPVTAEFALKQPRRSCPEPTRPAPENENQLERFTPHNKWIEGAQQDVVDALFCATHPDLPRDANLDEVANKRIRLASAICNFPDFKRILDDGKGGQRPVPTNQERMNKLVDMLHQAIWSAGRACGITTLHKIAPTAHDPAARRTPSANLRAAIDRKRKAYIELNRCPTVNKTAATLRFIEAAKHAARVQSEENSARWTSFIDRTMAAVRRGAQTAWDTVRKLKAPKTAASSVWQTIQDDRGNLQSEPEMIKRTWEAYVRKLFSFDNGLSDSHWQEPSTGETTEAARDNCASTQDMGPSISWPTCIKALRKLGNNKAPGPDGIPGEALKLLLAVEPTNRSEPTTLLGQALWFVYKAVWQTRFIPAQWRDSIIVFIQKKNTDPTVCTGYRGISLISAPAKVLCSMACICLESWFDSHDVICPEQYGFSSREECVAAIIALYETCIRRGAEGKASVLLFIDLQQAFDRVDHRGLSAKLKRVKCPNDLRLFIDALYACSTVRIKFHDGSLGNVIRLLIGVRQGCPMSPTLFKLDINDLPKFINDHVENAGMEVPGQPHARWSIALFADDTVEGAETVPQLAQMRAATVEWLTRNGYSANAPKSGIVTHSVTSEQGNEINKALEDNRDQLMFNGSPIPILPSYLYLGLLIDSQLSLAAMANDRIQKAENSLKAYRPILCNQSIPLSARVDAVVCCVQATISYGIALWGMDAKSVQNAQRVIDKALRITLGLGEHSRSAASDTIRHECGVASLTACAQAQAITLLLRGTNARRHSWFSTFAQEDEEFECPRSWFEYARKATRSAGTQLVALKETGLITKALDEKLQAKCKASSWKLYKDQRLHLTRIVANGFVWPAALGYGLHLLTKLRIGGVYLCPRLAHLPSNEGRPNICWACNEPDSRETISHLLLRCHKWNEARTRYLRQCIREARAALSRIQVTRTDDNVATLLLGGKIRSAGISRWGWQKSLHLEAVDTVDTPDWKLQPAYLCVAKFLQHIWPRRRRLVHALTL